jgi:hypothetical protein
MDGDLISDGEALCLIREVISVKEPVGSLLGDKPLLCFIIVQVLIALDIYH